MDHPWFTVNRLWIGHLTLQPQLGISLGKYSSSLWETSSTIFLKLCPTLPASVRQHQLPFPCWIWTSFICKNYANTETHNQAKSRARKLLYERWKLPFVDHSEGAWLCPLSHSTKSSKGTVFFFSYFGDDDPRHIEITCITLNKLLNQRQNWGTKPGFSNFKGQSFNHYVSMSLWLGASSDSVHFTTQLRFQNDFAAGTFLWTMLHWVSDTCCHSSSHCWALVPTKLAAHPHYT